MCIRDRAKLWKNICYNLCTQHWFKYHAYCLFIITHHIDNLKQNSSTSIPSELDKRKCSELLFTKSEVTLAYVYLSKVNCARDFRQLLTLAANICEMDKWIKISTTGNKLD